MLNALVLFVWGLAFLTVWLLISAVLVAVVVGPFALFQAWRTARWMALGLAAALAVSWLIELIDLLWSGIGFGRRWAPIVIHPILACGPLAAAWGITRHRLARPRHHAANGGMEP